MTSERIRIPARALRAGDMVSSGETVVSVSAGISTPRGKVDVTLARGERRRTAAWGASTLVTATRETAQASLPAIEAATTRERLEHRARQPLAGKVAQRPLDVGLFGPDAGQLDLMTALRASVALIEAEKGSPE
jgi:hypothetical protein